jgi:hypothetical protein
LEKSEGKSPPGRPCSRWEDNIKIDIKLIEWEVVDWVYLAGGVVLQLAVVMAVLTLRIL